MTGSSFVGLRGLGAEEVGERVTGRVSTLETHDFAVARHLVAAVADGQAHEKSQKPVKSTLLTRYRLFPGTYQSLVMRRSSVRF